MREAEALVHSGVRELLIVAQDTAAYGSDLRYRSDSWRGDELPSAIVPLCEALGSRGIWIRLHCVYPYSHVDKIIPLMAEGKLLPYLGIPFQHGSARILKQVQRPAAAGNILWRIGKWREICQQLCIRSTFIVRFPGGTDDDFEQLLEFLEDAQLDRVGWFQYSPIEGARANQVPESVPDEIKQSRWERFMQVQAGISESRLAGKVGAEPRCSWIPWPLVVAGPVEVAPMLRKSMDTSMLIRSGRLYPGSLSRFAFLKPINTTCTAVQFPACPGPAGTNIEPHFCPAIVNTG